MNKVEFLEKARDKHGYKYQYLDLEEKIISTDIIKISLNGDIYHQKVSKHLIGRCPEKNTPKKTTEQFIQESRKIWGDKYDYSLVDYKNSSTKVKIIYDNLIFEQNPMSHLKGLCVERNITIDNFIKKSNLIHNNRYDYSKVNEIKDEVLIGLNGVYYKQNPYNHLSGYKPENIKLSIRKNNEDFIRESNLVHDNKYNYDKTIYVKNQEKVIITCPLHGDFLQRPISHISGSGCPNCNEYLGERKISQFLKSKGINFERQKKFYDCRNVFELPFDFYIPSKRTLIEFDGIQHFQPIENFGGLEAYEKLKVDDQIKNDYCEENFINLIRIKYDLVNRIHEILSKNLK